MGVAAVKSGFLAGDGIGHIVVFHHNGFSKPSAGDGFAHNSVGNGVYGSSVGGFNIHSGMAAAIFTAIVKSIFARVRNGIRDFGVSNDVVFAKTPNQIGGIKSEIIVSIFRHGPEF